MKALQIFDDAYLVQCKKMSTQQILEFLESFRLCQEADGQSKLISIKVPEILLQGFKAKCTLNGVKYQTQIKKLMRTWLGF